jgi:glyoxylase-like metal-dependent hydrolase (beta-lactamase superfamily II)/rhodanese-related sulfurtransferase
MKVQQLYTGCLAEAAYYIESEGEAVIIDPLRDTQQYIDLAAKDGATIKYILETHFHADFVSGHLDLASRTNVTIVYGPTAKPNFRAHIAGDGEILRVGKATIKVLHTPGHTMESATFLLRDENGKDYAVFTGDTLFIGDVGRPDLAVKTDLTREDLAGLLFDSLRNKIMPLADETIIYPGHGAGSACGKKMAKERESTLGIQKQLNYALRADMTRGEFIKEVTTGLVEPPQYFPKNAVINKMGYESIDKVLERGKHALPVQRFVNVCHEHDALVLDTRKSEDFIREHLPTAINIGLDGQFASWVGTLIPDLKQPILLVAEPGREEEAILRLARVGYDNTIGYLDGGITAWKTAGKQTPAMPSISALEFAVRFQEGKDQVLDVRRRSEYDAEHIEGALNLPLDFVDRLVKGLDRKKTYMVHCAGGYRSVIAVSILKKRGFKHLINVEGGIQAIKKTGLVPITEYVEQLTAL